MSTYREDLHTGHKVPLVETDDIMNRAVTPEKLSDEAIALAGAFFQYLVFLRYDEETGNIWAYYGRDGKINSVGIDEVGNMDVYANFALPRGGEDYQPSAIGTLSVNEQTSEGGDLVINDLSDIQAVRLSGGDITSLTLASLPNKGQSRHIIISSEEQREVTVKASDTYITPSGEDEVFSVPANGYIEIDFLRIGDKVYVRGA